jgi:hypothetical protein
MIFAPRTLLALAALAATAVGPRAALADAVGPPPSCGWGETGVSDHGGGKCLKNAPTNCEPGWQGALGGTCIVHECSDDSTCGAGKTCREQSVCVKKYFRPNYGASPAARGDTRLVAFGPPPMEVGPPIEAWAAHAFCGPTTSCSGSDLRCEPRKVCLPTGVPAAVAMVPEADGAVRPPRGCGGCALADRDASPLALAAAIAALTATMWRRGARGRGA